MRRRIVAGNWKLHGSRAFATELLGGVVAGLPEAGVEVVVLPPLPYLGDLIEDFEEQGRREFGSQDVSCNEKGAYTGEVSAAMIADVGAKYGLVGHSERRQYHHERSEEHTSELQSLMRISYAVFCLKKKKTQNTRRENITKQYTTTSNTRRKN